MSCCRQVNGGYSKYALSGAPAPPPEEADEILYGVPWWDDNLEYAPTHPPQEDMVRASITVCQTVR